MRNGFNLTLVRHNDIKDGLNYDCIHAIIEAVTI